MGISFQNALGVHPMALQLRLARAELLSANLANADTPNFQAKDINFSAEMQRTKIASGFNNAFGSSTQQPILSSQSWSSQSLSPQIMYRMPYQPSQDGNTVALNVEQAAFSQNSLDYQTSLTFLNIKLSGLKKAIEGK